MVRVSVLSLVNPESAGMTGIRNLVLDDEASVDLPVSESASADGILSQLRFRSPTCDAATEVGKSQAGSSEDGAAPREAARYKTQLFVQPAPWFPVLPVAGSTSNPLAAASVPEGSDHKPLAVVALKYPLTALDTKIEFVPAEDIQVSSRGRGFGQRRGYGRDSDDESYYEEDEEYDDVEWEH